MKPRKIGVIALQDMPTGGSDRSLKKDVKPIRSALDKIVALRPVSWHWKAKSDNRPRYGFIAQELEEVFPHLVTEEAWRGDDTVKGDGSIRKHIDAHSLLPYLVKAVQEMQQEIDDLKKQLDDKDRRS